MHGYYKPYFSESLIREPQVSLGLTSRTFPSKGTPGGWGIFDVIAGDKVVHNRPKVKQGISPKFGKGGLDCLNEAPHRIASAVALRTISARVRLMISTIAKLPTTGW